MVGTLSHSSKRPSEGCHPLVLHCKFCGQPIDKNPSVAILFSPFSKHGFTQKQRLTSVSSSRRRRTVGSALTIPRAGETLEVWTARWRYRWSSPLFWEGQCVLRRPVRHCVITGGGAFCRRRR